MPGVIVGAYPLLSPNPGDGSTAALYERLTGLPSFGGLEIPWNGSFLPFDLAGLVAGSLPPGDVVLTTIPGTVAAGSKDSEYGLASPSVGGCQRAIDELSRVRDAVRRVHDAAGARTITGIELHSAPGGGYATRDSLARSLATVASWDWDGAELLLEHADAWTTEHAPAKGYLRLDDELVVLAAGLPIGLVVNWGRSAIELRDPDRVTEHLHQARDAGVLRTVMFSGVSDEPTRYGPAWSDQHLPFQGVDIDSEPLSLLTEHRITDALAAAGPGVRSGLKLSWRDPNREGADMLVSAVERLARLGE
jgi:hypothetical protein